MTTAALDPLSLTFGALADPTRRAILARLARGAASVKELSAPFRMSGPAITKHLRVLERAGLISRGRQAQWRPCALEARPLEQVAEWTNEFRQFWEANYRHLDLYLEQLQKERADAADADGR
jgi:DNA-binding transcriptional ArsR family regulator